MKCRGVSLVGPPDSVDASWVDPVKEMHADWVAVQPYAYSYNGKPEVWWGNGRQWWGETVNGSRSLVRHARGKGVKVMLKPMVYIPGSWPGDYTLATEADWKKWEESYAAYVMEFARLAAAEQVEMFVIGTEFKIAAQQRGAFWRKLIREVRAVYHGPITFAANWDSYQTVPFWDDLDFIGVDAYYPLVEAENPSVLALRMAWAAPLNELRAFHRKTGKKIIFTEFGYRSLGKAAWKHWEQEHISRHTGAQMTGQENAYAAFFEVVWNEEWFAGCFIWNWYTNHSRAGGTGNSDYTPQNKPAQKVISDWFSKI